MNKIVVGFLTPFTLGKYIKFTFAWAVIASTLQFVFLLFSDHSIYVFRAFAILSILGLAFSYTAFKEEFVETKFKLERFQLLRSLPAVILVYWVSHYPNAVSMKHAEWSVLIIIFVGFWSSQFAPVFRSLIKMKS
jgi:uncharacterized membrane protein